MANKSFLPIMTLLAVLLVVAACAGPQSGNEPPLKHPSADDLGEQPKICTDCHDARGEYVAYENFVHKGDYGVNHRAQAYRGESICTMCHQVSWCTDCHATSTEFKPSLKNQSETYRPMPHRGDYISRHRIDGRVNPTSCIRCHGNPRSGEICVRCHG